MTHTAGVDCHHRHAALGSSPAGASSRGNRVAAHRRADRQRRRHDPGGQPRDRARCSATPSTELIGQSVDVLVPDALAVGSCRAPRQRYLRHPKPRIMAAAREVFGRRKDGSEVPVEVGLTPVAASRDAVRPGLGHRRRPIATASSDACAASLDERLDSSRRSSASSALNSSISDPTTSIGRSRKRWAAWCGRSTSTEARCSSSWTRAATSSTRISGRGPAGRRRRRVISARGAISLASDADSRRRARQLRDARRGARRRSTARASARLGTRSSVTVPLAIEGRTWGAVSFGVVRDSAAVDAGGHQPASRRRADLRQRARAEAG